MKRYPLRAIVSFRRGQVRGARFTPNGQDIQGIEGAESDRVSSRERHLSSTSGWVSNLRLSPVSEALAFVEHPVRHDDAGRVRLLAAGASSVLQWRLGQYIRPRLASVG